MTLRTITIASSKGGVGKSTLASALAVQATKERAGNRVALLDWEPQGSITFWNAVRGNPDNPKLIPSAPDPVDTAKQLADSHDWLIIDTAPSGIDSIDRAIEAADFVLIPIHASFFDLAAVRPVAHLCLDSIKPFAFVLNEHDPRRKGLNESARKVLETIGGRILSSTIENRAAYVSAPNGGKTGPEHPDKKQREPAAAEIEALWLEIKALLKKGAAK